MIVSFIEIEFIVIKHIFMTVIYYSIKLWGRNFVKVLELGLLRRNYVEKTILTS